MLGKLPASGHPANLDYGKDLCACSMSGWGCLDILFSSIISFSLFETTRYRLKYCLKRPLNPNNQPTNLVQHQGAEVIGNAKTRSRKNMFSENDKIENGKKID